MTTFTSSLFNKIIIFTIIFHQVVCEDLNKSNWNIEVKNPNTSQNKLINSILNDHKISLKKSTDPRIRKIRSDYLDNFYLCVSKIENSETGAAVEYFGKLKSIPISDVINITYHSGNINDEILHLKNIIDFITQQPEREKYDKQAIETLYDLMKESNDLYSFKGVMLYYLIEDSPVKKDLSIRYIQLRLQNTYLVKIEKHMSDTILNDGLIDGFNHDYYDYWSPLLNVTFSNVIKNKSNLEIRLDKILNFLTCHIRYVQDAMNYYTAVFNELEKHDLLQYNNIREKFGRGYRKFMVEQSNYMTLNKPDHDTIVNMCNLFEYCHSEELYKSSASTAYLSSIFVITSIIIVRF